MIVKTEAVVLRAMKYRESSKIVSFYTKDFGMLSGIVKGARRAKNPFGSSLEPMSHVSLIVYKKPNRELQTVTQCEMIHSCRRLSEDLEKMSVAMSMIELVSLVAHEEENLPLFLLLVKSLEDIDTTTGNPAIIGWYFHLRLMTILGFQPKFDRCGGCHQPLITAGRPLKFDVSKGAPFCESCSSHSGSLVSVSSAVFDMLSRLNSGEQIHHAQSRAFDARMKEELESFLRTYLRFHIPGIRMLRSEKVFSQILTPA